MAFALRQNVAALSARGSRTNAVRVEAKVKIGINGTLVHEQFTWVSDWVSRG